MSPRRLKLPNNSNMTTEVNSIKKEIDSVKTTICGLSDSIKALQEELKSMKSSIEDILGNSVALQNKNVAEIVKTEIKDHIESYELKLETLTRNKNAEYLILSETIEKIETKVGLSNKKSKTPAKNSQARKETKTPNSSKKKDRRVQFCI